MIYQTVILASIVALCASNKLYTEDPDQQNTIFTRFQDDFNKRYSSTQEQTKRFQIFLQNLQVADQRNAEERANGGTARHGITKFSDLTPQEFKNKVLAKITRKATGHNGAESHLNRHLREGEDRMLTTATLKDWTGIYTTPVKNQAQCGSCWAFSAAEQIESDSMRLLKKSWLLSPEQFVQCVTACGGCNGGDTAITFNYAKSHYVEQESSYPYTSSTGITGVCSYNSMKGVVSVSSYTQITASTVANTETAMANYVQTTGPLSICLDASNWNSYTDGIMSICGKDVDHCVQAVGVLPTTTGGYWKVRNQWGTNWGEQGFIRLNYGNNTCNIVSEAIYTTVKAK